MTEDEAKTKWCPFAIAAHYENGTQPIVANRYQTAGAARANCLCLASGCMAWRESYCGIAGAPAAPPADAGAGQ